MKPTYSTILKSTKTGISNYVFANYTITFFGIGYLHTSSFRRTFINTDELDKYTENLAYQNIKKLIKNSYVYSDKDEKMMLQLAKIVANCKSDLSDLEQRLQKVVYDGVTLTTELLHIRDGDEISVEVYFVSVSEEKRTKGSYIIQLKRNQ